MYKSPRDVCVRSCQRALEVGYRHIDTAQFYDNEAEVGQAVQQSTVDRKDVYITTKILVPAESPDKIYQSCVDSVKKLDPETNYVDLFLIHSPNKGAASRKDMWQALERLHLEGKAKSIGVSNFGIGHIEELKSFARVWPPHVNQIELHPWAQQKEIVDYCNKNKIIVEAYCPIVRNQKANDPTLAGLASKHKTTPNQVLIRYCLQKGWSPLPKSDDPERIKVNADVYGFVLDEEDMKALDKLDEGASGAIVQVVDNS